MLHWGQEQHLPRRADKALQGVTQQDTSAWVHEPNITTGKWKKRNQKKSFQHLKVQVGWQLEELKHVWQGITNQSVWICEYNVDAANALMLGDKTVSVFLKISFTSSVAFPEGHFDLVEVN